jgi:OmcA/MtrC family decaheme c-type cytochrome
MMDVSTQGRFRLIALLAVAVLSLGIAGCGGSDGDDGAAGATGPAGADGSDGFSCWDLNENGVKDPEEDLNGDGEVNVLDCNATANAAIIPIGDGSTLTEEQAEQLGRLVATIDGVEITSPPVVSFTVTDSSGNPAVGITSRVWFTIAKLVPGDTSTPAFNGGLPYWQSYVNRLELADGTEPDVLESALQATTDSSGTLEEVNPGQYEYTFATDITDPTQTQGIVYEPNLTTRVGLEIRLNGDFEEELAPLNPVFDFVPDGSAGSGVTKDIADTANCSKCHYQFDLHGGPRKTVKYCVTCHNPGTYDQDTGNAVDMAHLAHSIHPGLTRGDLDCNPGESDPADPDFCENQYPYIIYGYGENDHDFSHVTYPQDLLYCESCHLESETHPDGNAWNEAASAKTCGGCHADGLEAGTPDPVTGQPDAYAFNHQNADTNVGIAEDGVCGGCHLGSITNAGPALAIHSSIRGSDRAQAAAGDNFVFEIISATNTGPGETPVVTFKVSDPDGNPYDILTDPEFTDDASALNLYVQWSTDAYYGGDEDGLVLGGRIPGSSGLPTQAIQDLNFRDTGYPLRMRLSAIQDVAVKNADGSFTVTYYRALPTNFTGKVAIALGGHPAWEYTDADGFTDFDRAMAVSAVFYPGETDPNVATTRAPAFDSKQCNACHKRLNEHGANRNGNAEICLLCHNGDAAVCDSGDALPSCPDDVAMEGYGFGYMIHSIHRASKTWLEGYAAEVTYPQSLANCFTCHKDGKYSVARATARSVSTDMGPDIRVWTDDIATTPTSIVCGVCHSSSAAKGHFESQGGLVDRPKSLIASLSADTGVPNGQEACAVCHGAGSTFDTALFHHTPE